MTVPSPSGTAVDSGLLGRLELIRQSFLRTPLVRLPHDRLRLFSKLEYCNPTGSTKDRSSYWILRRAIERGEIRSGTTIVESSSGNFALSLASLCRFLGLSFVPVIDPNINKVTERQLRILCSRVEKVAELDETGGYLTTRLDRVRHLVAEQPDAYWPNQYANIDAVEAHEVLTGGELCADLSELDYLFVGVSTGGTIAGLSRRVRESFPRAKIVAVDSEGSAIFSSRPRKRYIPGIGSSTTPSLLDLAVIDDVVIVPERAAVRACHELFARYGLFAGGSTGSVYAAISRFFEGGEAINPTVAFLCADRGTGYLETIYNPGWADHVLGALPSEGRRR